MTYIVVKRDPNSWIQTDKGDCHSITWDCGHHHRTLSGAEKCRRKHANFGESYGARIEISAQNQQYDGKPLDEEERYRAMEMVGY